jgi:PAS domain S-box-containing protein
MTEESKKDNQKKLLRKKAEKFIHHNKEHKHPINPNETQRLLQELQVHKVELEMQNEELKKTTHDLECSKEHYLDLYNNAPVGYMILDEKSNIIQTNTTALNYFKIKSCDIIDQKFQKFIHKDDQDIFYIFNKEEEHSCTLRILKGDSSYFWGHMKSSSEKNDTGKTIFKIAIEDITAQKSLEDELKIKDNFAILQSKQAAMGEMISMIAHQWKQPLSILSMISNTIKLDLDLENEISDKYLYEKCEEISTQVQYLANTIDDFANFLKPHENSLPIFVSDIVKDTLKMIGKSLNNHEIEVIFNADCKILVNVKHNELVQVLLIILNNAKYNLIENNIKDATITITVKEHDHNVIIDICNNGTSIPEEILSSLGKPYITTKSEKGTGLGIYISKMILEKHMNGTLTWKNIPTGTCFSLSIGN